jgi:putative alpha-1,2-mannosidase
MAAWFILSALGLYPVCPGKPSYTLGSPLFARATVRLPGNETFVIEAPGKSESAVFVRSVQLNGQPHTGKKLEHAPLRRGGTLSFGMAIASAKLRASPGRGTAFSYRQTTGA